MDHQKDRQANSAIVGPFDERPRMIFTEKFKMLTENFEKSSNNEHTKNWFDRVKNTKKHLRRYRKQLHHNKHICFCNKTHQGSTNT